MRIRRAGILREVDSPGITINTWRDHVHVLFTLSKNQPLTRVVMEVKSATSKWLKTTSAEFAILRSDKAKLPRSP